MSDLTTHLLIACMLAQGVLLSFQIPRHGGNWWRCHWLGKLALLMLAVLSLPIGDDGVASGTAGSGLQTEIRLSDPDAAMLNFVAANLAHMRRVRHDSPTVERIPVATGHRAP